MTPTNISQTTEAAPNVNRRRFLLNAATTGAAVAVCAPVVAAEQEIHPLTRLHALHDEASALMAVHNEWMGGEWELRIRAPNARHPILYTNLDTSLDAEMTPRERAIWHIRELQRLALEDGAGEAMVVVTGRFHAPEFHCKTLMLGHTSDSIDDFGHSDFLVRKAVQA